MPPVKLQLMQQGSVCEDGGHGPCLCHCLQEQTPKCRADGRTGSMWWNDSPTQTYQCM